MGEITRKHVPMLRYAFYLLCGTALAAYVTIPLQLSVFILIVSLVYLMYRIRFSVAAYRMHLGITIPIIVLMLGIVRQTCWMQAASEETVIRSIRINSFPERKRHIIQFEAVAVSDQAFDLSDKQRFLVFCNDTNAVLHYGDILKMNVQPLPVQNDALPFQFDYASYLKSRGILKKITLCTAERIPDCGLSSVFYTWINTSRRQFKTLTAEIFHSKSSKGLAESLLLGYKEDLDASTKEAFQKSGVSHLLAVSGMHTALIYELLFLLFLPLGTSQKHRFVFLILALSVLIYFTILSGGSASVMRSSVMCSMLAIGYAFHKKGSGLNTLGISICVLIGWAPYQLWDLGFQLSVMAVFGILTIHARIATKFEQLHTVPKYLLNAISITVSAQIMTLPVILYHFHSFPLYFIPANLILIPVSTLALFSTMTCLLIASTGLYIEWLFGINEWIVHYFEQCTAFLASLPNSILYPVSFSKTEFIVVLILISIYLFVYPMKRTFVLCMVTISLFWCCLRLYNEQQYLGRKSNLFICNAKKSALLNIDGLNADLYCLPSFNALEKKNLQEYFNLRKMQSHILEPNIPGIIWKYNSCHAGWLLHKNTTVQNLKLCYLFSPYTSDTSVVTTQYHKKTGTKSMYFLK